MPEANAPAAGAAPSDTPAAGVAPAAPINDPAAQPVVPPAATPPTPPATPPAAPAEPAVEVVEYEPTGNAGLDLGLKFIGKLGFGPEHPAVQAAGTGDFSKLEAELAKLGDKAAGWQDILAVSKVAYSQMDADSKAAHEKTMGKINAVTDGEWDKAKEWAAAKAEPAEKEAINAALAAGGIQAVAMAQYITTLYRKSDSYTTQGKPAVPPTSAAGTAVNDALSPKQYVDEVRKLAARGGVYEGSKEYAALQQRRQAWRG